MEGSKPKAVAVINPFSGFQSHKQLKKQQKAAEIKAAVFFKNELFKKKLASQVETNEEVEARLQARRVAAARRLEMRVLRAQRKAQEQLEDEIARLKNQTDYQTSSESPSSTDDVDDTQGSESRPLTAATDSTEPGNTPREDTSADLNAWKFAGWDNTTDNQQEQQVDTQDSDDEPPPMKMEPEESEDEQQREREKQKLAAKRRFSLSATDEFLSQLKQETTSTSNSPMKQASPKKTGGERVVHSASRMRRIASKWEGYMKLTKQIRTKRHQMLTQQSLLQARLDAFWNVTSREDEPSLATLINRQEFYHVHSYITFALMGSSGRGKKASMLAELQFVQYASYIPPTSSTKNSRPGTANSSDSKHDEATELDFDVEFLGREQFDYYLLELADLWTLTADPNMYLFFLDTLYMSITTVVDEPEKKHSKKSKKKHTKHAMSSTSSSSHEKKRILHEEMEHCDTMRPQLEAQTRMLNDAPGAEEKGVEMHMRFLSPSMLLMPLFRERVILSKWLVFQNIYKEKSEKKALLTVDIHADATKRRNSVIEMETQMYTQSQGVIEDLMSSDSDDDNEKNNNNHKKRTGPVTASTHFKNDPISTMEQQQQKKTKLKKKKKKLKKAASNISSSSTPKGGAMMKNRKGLGKRGGSKGSKKKNGVLMAKAMTPKSKAAHQSATSMIDAGLQALLAEEQEKQSDVSSSLTGVLLSDEKKKQEKEIEESDEEETQEDRLLRQREEMLTKLNASMDRLNASSSKLQERKAALLTQHALSSNNVQADVKRELADIEQKQEQHEFQVWLAKEENAAMNNEKKKKNVSWGNHPNEEAADAKNGHDKQDVELGPVRDTDGDALDTIFSSKRHLSTRSMSSSELHRRSNSSQGSKRRGRKQFNEEGKEITAHEWKEAPVLDMESHLKAAYRRFLAEKHVQNDHNNGNDDGLSPRSVLHRAQTHALTAEEDSVVQDLLGRVVLTARGGASDGGQTTVYKAVSSQSQPFAFDEDDHNVDNKQHQYHFFQQQQRLSSSRGSHSFHRGNSQRAIEPFWTSHSRSSTALLPYRASSDASKKQQRLNRTRSMEFQRHHDGSLRYSQSAHSLQRRHDTHHTEVKIPFSGVQDRISLRSRQMINKFDEFGYRFRKPDDIAAQKEKRARNIYATTRGLYRPSTSMSSALEEQRVATGLGSTRIRSAIPTPNPAPQPNMDVLSFHVKNGDRRHGATPQMKFTIRVNDDIKAKLLDTRRRRPMKRFPGDDFYH